MKYIYTLAALVALVSAQELPTCAVSCIRDATESETSCTFGDAACTCQPANREKVTAVATPCVISACGLEVAVGEVVPAIEALCANPPSGGEDTTAAPAPSTTAAPPPAESSEEAAESTPAAEPSAAESDYPVPSAAESDYPVPSAAESDYPVPSAEPSHVAPSNGTVPVPEPSHVEAGAAKAGFMGAAALAGLAVLAL